MFGYILVGKHIKMLCGLKKHYFSGLENRTQVFQGMEYPLSVKVVSGAQEHFYSGNQGQAYSAPISLFSGLVMVDLYLSGSVFQQ